MCQRSAALSRIAEIVTGEPGVSDDLSADASDQENYRLIAEHATDMITRLSTTEHYTYVSPACRMLLGYAPEELIGKAGET